MQKLTPQEMFNRAYIGLQSQNWKQCVDPNDCHICVYSDGRGCHCAWGWVDPDLTDAQAKGANIETLRVGLARELSTSDRVFAQNLQDAHDRAFEGLVGIKDRMERLAVRYNLTIPSREAA